METATSGCGSYGVVRSAPAFLALAAAVTLSPGPAFALLLQFAAVHGRRCALATIAGNSVGVLLWGVLSAVGVAAVISANRLAHETLHLAGAAFLASLGLRALLSARSARHASDVAENPRPSAVRLTVKRAARRGLVNSLANPKLAVFFVALFPQFLTPGAAVLPAALAMSAVIVAFDVMWYGAIAVVVDRFRRVVGRRLARRLQQVSGAVLVAVGLRLATEAR